MKGSKGFTIVEVIVVAAIIIVVTGFLITDFSRTKLDLNVAATASLDALREAQADAQAGRIFQGAYRCGYGIHFEATSYIIYAGPNSSLVNCATDNRNYNAGTDLIVRQQLLQNLNLEYVPSVDVFFEPPNPTTYIGGSSAAGVSTTISLRIKGATCPSANCKTIYVETSGRNELQ